MKTLITGGTVYDGTGGEPKHCDILLENGRIAELGGGFEGLDAEIIDAAGRTVTPGFIDMHRHCDIAPLRDADFGELELVQGVTANVVGNCGLAPVPVSAEHAREARDFLEPVTGEISESHAFQSYAAYFDAIKAAKPAISMGALAGTGAIKAAIKGYVETPYTEAELQKAQAYVREAIGQGVFGCSMGFMYPPESYTTPEEQLRIIEPMAKAGGLLTAHIRGEGDSLADSVREAIDIAEQAGIRLHISHFKSTGIANWNREIHRATELIEAARNKGGRVTVDFYPYTGGSTTLLSLLPPSVLGGGVEKALRRLAEPEGKEILRRELGKKHMGWDNMALSIGWDRIAVTSGGGRSIAELAVEAGCDEPAEFLWHLLKRGGAKTGIVVFSMAQGDVDTVARLPYAAAVSDALYSGGTSPHPRLYGAFPRIIREYVLERGVLLMQTAIHKMTALPASILGLEDRGLIKEGLVADLNIFSPEELRDNAAYSDSRRLATGMGRVIMGGRTVLLEGGVKERHAGAILTRKY